MPTLTSQDVLPLEAGRYAVAISWDKTGGPTVDVDIQAVIVDTKGSIIDAVYYNNMKALGCFTHSGDEQTGEKAGLDEVIWATMSKIPEHVVLVIFVVAAHTGGHLRDVENGMIHLLEDKKDNEIGRFRMERSKAEVDVVASMVRQQSGSWFFQVVEEPAIDGQHFMDILEPTIGNIIRRAIPSAPKRQKVAFAMDKGSVLDLPDTEKLDMVVTGLGWDVIGKGVDLDVSAVLFDSGAKVVNCVFFGNLSACGVSHSGDNLTGEGDGDDEQIKINMKSLPPQIKQVFLVVNIYTKGVTFERVRNAYCRIFDNQNNELARYVLQEAGSKSCLLMARLFRETGGRWSFQALGTFSHGTMWKDAVPDMQRLLRTPARQLQYQTQTSAGLQTQSQSNRAASGSQLFGSGKQTSTGGGQGGGTTASGPPVANQGCCHVQ